MKISSSYRWTVIAAKARLDSATTPIRVVADLSILLYFPFHSEEEPIDLIQTLLVKVSFAEPSRTRNALTVEDKRKIPLQVWKQARQSILPNSLRGPGRRLPLFQHLVARMLIHDLHNIIVRAELLWPALPLSRAVFFSSHA
jgi:hypothetical protein